MSTDKESGMAKAIALVAAVNDRITDVEIVADNLKAVGLTAPCHQLYVACVSIKKILREISAEISNDLHAQFRASMDGTGAILKALVERIDEENSK